MWNKILFQNFKINSISQIKFTQFRENSDIGEIVTKREEEL